MRHNITKNAEQEMKIINTQNTLGNMTVNLHPTNIFAIRCLPTGVLSDPKRNML